MLISSVNIHVLICYKQIRFYYGHLFFLGTLHIQVQLLEERHYSSSPVTTKLKKEEECKTLSSALEEVNHKGTLMERLTMLESQVLQVMYY